MFSFKKVTAIIAVCSIGMASASVKGKGGKTPTPNTIQGWIDELEFAVDLDVKLTDGHAEKAAIMAEFEQSDILEVIKLVKRTVKFIKDARTLRAEIAGGVKPTQDNVDSVSDLYRKSADINNLPKMLALRAKIATFKAVAEAAKGARGALNKSLKDAGFDNTCETYVALDKELKDARSSFRTAGCEAAVTEAAGLFTALRAKCEVAGATEAAIRAKRAAEEEQRVNDEIRRKAQVEEDRKQKLIDEAKAAEMSQKQREAALKAKEEAAKQTPPTVSPKAAQASEAAAADDSTEKMATPKQKAEMLVMKDSLLKVAGDEAASVAAWIDEIVAEEDFVEDTVLAASILGEIVTLIKTMPEDAPQCERLMDDAIEDSSLSNLTRIRNCLVTGRPESPVAATEDSLAAELESVLSMSPSDAAAVADEEFDEEVDTFESILARPSAADEEMADDFERVLSLGD